MQAGHSESRAQQAPRAMAPTYRPNLVTVMAKATSPTVRGGSPGHRYSAKPYSKAAGTYAVSDSLNPMGPYY